MLGGMRQNIPVMTMQQALMSHQDLDMVVIDESDQCLMELGSAFDESKQIVSGFWDLLEKRTVLLTATVGNDLIDILFELYGIK